MAAYADGAVIISIDADGRLAIKELEGTKEALGEFGNKAEDTNQKVDELGDKVQEAKIDLKELAVAASAVTAGLVATGVATVNASSQFESAFAKTRTIMDANVVAVSDMRAEILDLSRDAAMAGTNVSEAVYQAISGSVATQDAVDFVDRANKLSVAGFTGLENATDILTTTVNAYHMKAEQVGGISNVLIQTQNLGKTSVDQLAANMGRAIATGSAYGVNLQNIATSYVELTRAGIATAEATTYLSGMLNELGKADSEVAKIIQAETGRSFGQLMSDGYSLGDVLQILNTKVDGNTEAFMGLWGSQEAAKAGNALLSMSVEDFNNVLAQMNNELDGTTGTTEKAYRTMTSTSEFIDRRLSNSITNLGVAIGDDLRPTVDGVKKLLVGITDWGTEFITQNPRVSAAFAGMTVSIGALAVGLTLYTLKAKLAESATLKLSAAMLKNPVALGLTAITAVIAGIATFATVSANATEETEKLSAASEQHRQEIEAMKEEYDALCDSQGKNSAEAVLLKQRIEEETEAFERNKQTEAEYQEQQEAFWGAIEEGTTAHREKIDALDDEYASTTSLIERLQELTNAEYQTAAAKEEILAIVDLLNQRMPQLGLTYDRLTGLLNLSPEQIATMAEEDYRNKAAQENYDRLVELLGKKEEAYRQLEAARDDLNAKRNDLNTVEEERYRFYNANPSNSSPKILYDKNRLDKRQKSAREKFDTSSAALDERFDAYMAIINEIDHLSNILAGGTQNEADAYGDASAAVKSYASEMQVLTEAYESSYKAAYKSISGQLELWETAPNVARKSVDDLLHAVHTQATYWTDYNSNLDTILTYSGQIDGLNEVIGALGTGTEEAVNYSAAIARALQDGNIDKVKNLTDEYRTLKLAQDNAASKFSDIETEYSSKVLELAEGLASDLEEMNIDQTAYDLGALAIDQFVNGASDKLPLVQQAYSLIGDTARQALSGALQGINSVAGGLAAIEGRNSIVSSDLLPDASAFLPLPIDAEATTDRALTDDEIANGQKSVFSEVYGDLGDLVGPAPVSSVLSAAQGNDEHLHVSITVPLEIDGREFARATAEYNGEEMEFGVI